jgi:ribosomal protein L29
MKTVELAWLEKTYDQRRQRTVDLTSRAIDKIRSESGRISLSKIVSASKELDEHGRGISSSAVLSNPDAYNIYVAARAWKRLKRFSVPVNHCILDPQIKSGRDEKTLRLRLRKLSKEQLVERIVALEASLVEMRSVLIRQKVAEVKDIVGNKGDES